MTQLISATWTLFAGAMVLCLPGFAWLVFFWDSRQDVFERLAEVLGLSIALIAVFAQFAYLLDWRITSTSLIVIFTVLAIPVFWALSRRWKERKWGLSNFDHPGDDDPNPVEIADQDHQISEQFQGKLSYLILILILLVVLVWRFHQIREIILPLWVDSIHHVQIVAMFIENGGIPENFEPYMPVPFYYHYAFHALAAVFSFFTRLSPSEAVLFLGQVLNAAIALGVYRLGKALWGDWRRAVLSTILVAFVTQMPAYYVTWGRYTLLTGMLLLNLAMASALDIVNKGALKSRLFTFGLLTAGILLSHYFASILLALFLVVLGIHVLLENLRKRVRPAWNVWLPMGLAAIAGLLVASPWLYRMWGFAQRGVKIVTIQPTLEAINGLYFPEYLTYLWRLLGPARNQALLFAALPGLVISLIRKRTRPFGIWTIILCIISLPVGFYVAPFRPDHAVIVLFLPTALLLADLLVSIIDWSPIEKLSTIKVVVVLVGFTCLVGWGIFETQSVINSATILASGDDLEALDWIEDNTPPDARFGINVVHWQYGSYRGVDGGWWVTPLTGRWAILPNVLYVMGSVEYAQQVNSLAEKFSQLTGCTPEFWEIVQEEDLTYLYLSANKGSLQPDQFQDCPGVELIFSNESVYLYRIEYIINRIQN
jgi:hypothetical protein